MQDIPEGTKVRITTREFVAEGFGEGCIVERVFSPRDDEVSIRFDSADDFKYLGPGDFEILNTEDVGKHYRYGFRLNLTRQDIDNGYVTVNIDPYRISDVYNLSGWREHLIKKALRYTDKGHSLDELFKELRCTIDRAEEIMHESSVPTEQTE